MNAAEVEKAHDEVREAVAKLVRVGYPGALVVDLVVLVSVHSVGTDGATVSNVLALPAFSQPNHRTLGLLQAGYTGFARHMFSGSF